MLSLARRVHRSALNPCSHIQYRYARTDAGSSPTRRRSRFAPGSMLKKTEEAKSEWWIVDGEMHEIGDNVPPRERFVITRENIPNKRRKQLREQFMRRTRLVLKESDHEPWCKRYMELYNELRENWERLYWDEGYSKKLAQDHANYDSAGDDEEDFNPYRRRQAPGDQRKDQGIRRNREVDTWQKVNQIRDKFEYDRDRRMREKAFAPMSGGNDFSSPDSASRNSPFNAKQYVSASDSE